MRKLATLHVQPRRERGAILVTALLMLLVLRVWLGVTEGSFLGAGG